jgi:hypothetical protein
MARLLLVAAVVLLAIATFFFSRDQPNREYLDRELESARPVDGRPLTVPERVLFYGADELNALKAFLGSRKRSELQTALQFYVRPVLIWNDLVFAVALAGFVVISWLCIISIFDVSGGLRHLFLFFAAMGFLYGLADVGEDLYLANLLSRHRAVSQAEGYCATALTTVKIGANIASIQGAIVFQGLSWIFPQPVR